MPGVVSKWLLCDHDVREAIEPSTESWVNREPATNADVPKQSATRRTGRTDQQITTTVLGLRFGRLCVRREIRTEEWWTNGPRPRLLTKSGKPTRLAPRQ